VSSDSESSDSEEMYSGLIGRYKRDIWVCVRPSELVCWRGRVRGGDLPLVCDGNISLDNRQCRVRVRIQGYSPGANRAYYNLPSLIIDD
jgi:hypothetical protein